MLDRIYIEISNICNLQCTFCPVVERDKKIMSFADFQHVINEAKPLAKEVCLHLMGEPTAHPEFVKIVKYCEEIGVQLKITTNGLLVKKHRQILFSKAIKQINFSVQSYKDNFPDKSLTDYMLSLFEFCDYLRAVNPETYVNFRLWNLGAQSSENEICISLIERYFCTSINRQVDVGFQKSKRIKHRFYLHFDSRFEWPSEQLPYQGSVGRCHGVTGHIGIHADGTVVPCCLDKEAKIKLGNVFEQSLNAILYGERAQNMREGFQLFELRETLCQHCSFVNRFKKPLQKPLQKPVKQANVHETYQESLL